MLNKEQMQELKKEAGSLTLSKFGSARRQYLYNNPHLMNEYLRSGILVEHLNDIDNEALAERDRIMKIQMNHDGVNEELKASDFSLYLQKLQAIEMDVSLQIMHDIIYA